MSRVTTERLDELIAVAIGRDTKASLRELQSYRKAVREYLEAVDALAKIPYEIDSGQRRIAALNDRDVAEANLRALERG